MIRNKEYWDWVWHRLENWRYTFDNETDEVNEIEGDEKGYDEITLLMDKIKDFKKLTSKDYENILFHLWQESLGRDKE